MNVDELEGNPKVTSLYAKGQVLSDVHLLLCWRQSGEQTGSRQYHIVLRRANELDIRARWATGLGSFSLQRPKMSLIKDAVN